MRGNGTEKHGTAPCTYPTLLANANGPATIPLPLCINILRRESSRELTSNGEEEVPLRSMHRFDAPLLAHVKVARLTEVNSRQRECENGYVE